MFLKCKANTIAEATVLINTIHIKTIKPVCCKKGTDEVALYEIRTTDSDVYLCDDVDSIKIITY